MARLTEIHRQQFLKIIFDVDAQFHDFFFLVSKDSDEIFVVESRLPHEY
jgi:hypothetical protein